MHVERYGHGGAPILLVHGFGTCSFLWRGIGPTLATANRTAFAIDLFGHGESDRPFDAQFGIAAQSDYLDRALTAFSVDPNTTTWIRTGSLLIAGTLFTVNQGGPCAPTITPTSQSFTSAAGVGSTSVKAADWCDWTAVSKSEWITVTSGASGTGNGTVSFSVNQNSTTSNRTGSLTIAGATFTVSQLAAGATCATSISPLGQSFTSSAGSGSIAVTAAQGCAWTAVSGVSWITTSATGTGNGTAAYSVAANTTTASRTGTITIGNATFTVTQAASCSYTLSPSSLSVPATLTTGTITVTTQPGCTWTASTTAVWITVSGSGNGNGTATYTIAANDTTLSRTRSIFIGNQTLTVTQAAMTGPTAPSSLRIIKQ